MQEDEPASEHRSATASELRRIPSRVHRLLGIPDWLPEALDVLVATLHDLLDDSEEQDWESRFDRIVVRIEQFFPDGVPDERVTKFLEFNESEIKTRVERYAARYKDGNGKRFMNRLLGTKTFDRLKSAVEQDWSLFLVGSRRLLRAAMPLAQAIEDALLPLSAQERSSLGALTEAQAVLLNSALQIDQQIGAFFDKRDMDFIELNLPIRDDEATTLDIDVSELSTMMRGFLDNEVQRRAAELSDVLARKLRGFEHALANSDDGVSQAASSLVEFIDRLLRMSFTTQEVLTWIDSSLPDDKTLVFERNGQRVPTKRGTALCFAYAGQPPMENSTLEPLVALSLVKVRNAAEKLKHADEGTPEEAEQLRHLMQALRGALMFIFRFSWQLIAGDGYDRLREKFMQHAA